ncbi:unnamed protein product [Arctia plantaginis]|uniref:Uncharacterized protein n=1 Tax=Arctia plantaginis TaxID=874455 RepID=A0A8S1ATI3_ARCPL|nr:unnamed protein product [Arctia plantaginis]
MLQNLLVKQVYGSSDGNCYGPLLTFTTLHLRKPTIILLSRILDITRFVIVGEEGHDNDTDSDYFIPKGAVTGDDVLDYIYARRSR